MVKYSDDIMKQMRQLFGDNLVMMDMARRGDTALVSALHSKLGFYLDEDDIIKAFRNKKEHRVLEMAKRAKAVRDLYQQVWHFVDAAETKRAEKNGYADCL